MCQLCDNASSSEQVIAEHAVSKRNFLKTLSLSGLGLASLSLGNAMAADQSMLPKPENAMTPEAAFKRLMAGNERYATGASTPFDFNRDRTALAGGQNPYASILSCADSRITPELCFDEQRGDLFVTRVAGNYLTTDILPSLEFAALVLGVPLIMVLGHQQCGAVNASIAATEQHQDFPGHIQTITTAIAPAVKATLKDSGDRLETVTRKNVLLNMERIKQSGPIISKMVAEKKVRVVGGVYNLTTGRVELLC